MAEFDDEPPILLKISSHGVNQNKRYKIRRILKAKKNSRKGRPAKFARKKIISKKSVKFAKFELNCEDHEKEKVIQIDDDIISIKIEDDTDNEEKMDMEMFSCFLCNSSFSKDILVSCNSGLL